MAAKQLATNVCNIISSKLGTYNRGHKNADFAVLRLSKMPAILVETAFIDNSSDGNKLITKQDDFASAICNAIVGSGDAEYVPNDQISNIPSISGGLKILSEFGMDEFEKVLNSPLFQHLGLEFNTDKLKPFKGLNDINDFLKSNKVVLMAKPWIDMHGEVAVKPTMDII